ncbi:MAG: thiolase family protein [Candidatus Cloacimonetes bacterium]|nr:thiolase family protein [Candidatus Cloacimonadota bacterium]
MAERIAIIDGVRTPFCKSTNPKVPGVLGEMQADDLGAHVVKELLAKTGFDANDLDEIIFGNVIQPPQSTNLTRILAVKAGVPERIPSYTVNRNCASGMESVTTGMNKILAGYADVILAGGCESMSNVPILFGKKMIDIFMGLGKAKSLSAKLDVISKFRPAFLAPVIPGLLDPLCSLQMGQTAELISKDFSISRLEQDEFAMMSQNRAEAARANGIFEDEIVPIPVGPKYTAVQTEDDGIRNGTDLKGLQKLRPCFDRLAGTVTPANCSQITDGAAGLIIMRESKAKAMGLTPIGYLTDYAYAGLAPDRMGLGPVYATSQILERTGKQLGDFDLIEINEAFAAQVIGCERAMASKEYCQKYLGRADAIGVVDRDKLNVNGGAISLGHPVGATGTRLIIHTLKELKRRKKQHGLVTLCIGGGQGTALTLEAE